MVLQKLWVPQNFSRILQVSQSRFSAVMFSFFYTKVSQSRFFARLRVSHSKPFDMKSWSRNLKSPNVSSSQRKTLVSPSRKVSHLPFSIPNSKTLLTMLRVFYYRRIFVYTFCLINICLSLSDDANKIKTLNIERE